MRALVLAAGRGSRMGTLTARTPKCLTPLAGRPLLHWQLNALRGAGISSIALVRGYQAETLTPEGVRFFHNPRWNSSNMVASLCCASDWLEGQTCIISYSDIVYTPSVIESLMNARGDVAITYDTQWADLWTRRFGNPLIDAETFRVDPKGRVLEIGGKPTALEQVQGQYMGLLKFTATGWKTIAGYLQGLESSAVDKLHMTTLLRSLIGRGVSIEGIPIEGGWYEVDSESDLRLYEGLIAAGQSWIRKDAA